MAIADAAVCPKRLGIDTPLSSWVTGEDWCVASSYLEKLSDFWKASELTKRTFLLFVANAASSK